MFLIILIILTSSILGWFAYVQNYSKPIETAYNSQDHVLIAPPEQNPTPKAQIQAAEILPKVFLNKAPFTVQAPTANWNDKMYAEGCEEASMLMAAEYFSGNTESMLNTSYALEKIKELAEWEQEKFGYHLDINAEKMAITLKEYLGLNAEIIHSMTEDHMKSELLKNRLIIWIVNGQELNNPNFRTPGPPFHVLLIKGYDSEGFVTNDPGTRKGMNYPYTYETLFNAGGDWDHTINAVNKGSKTAIVVWKN
ncbi:MAG: C39 family peptidase [Candidatus Doudnabacteria bacterium]|nr:C39 family peptidase [Candidatus Doudnabacteria bacterium]